MTGQLPRRVVSRRQLLTSAAAGAAGLGVGVGLGDRFGNPGSPAPTPVQPDGVATRGTRSADTSAAADQSTGTIDPHGAHQAGIAQPVPDALTLCALDLRDGVGRDALGRLLRVWSEDIRALSGGLPPTGDPAPELTGQPAGLTVTVGVGPRLVSRVHPPGGWPDLPSLPPMRHDSLRAELCGGDLLVQVGAQEALPVWHAVRRLTVDAAPFARVRWMQRGFWRHGAAGAPDAVGRNLMGQVDGTANPVPGTTVFDRTVWVSDGPEWLREGTMVVIRRIRMDLDAWDRLSRPDQEAVIGRTLVDGAPLGGQVGDPLPLTARAPDGRLVIPPDAHARLAHPSTNGGVRIYRRGVNYDDGPDATGRPDLGLLFVSFQASVDRQLLPILRRLDRSDALNTWTTTTASSMFAILPGFTPDSWLGERLLA